MSDTHLAVMRETASELESWKSSYALPHGTQERIRKLLDETAADTVSRNPENLETPRHLKNLEQRKVADAARISLLRSAISVVKTLPTEILEIIFDDFNDGEMVTLPLSKVDFKPWILGHICARWRRILWNSPSIWSRILIRVWSDHVYTYYNATSSSKNICETFKYILSSTSTTISLFVSSYDSEAIFDNILSYSKRFKSLSLYNLRSESLFTLLDLPPRSLDSLETLVVNYVSEAHTKHPKPNGNMSCLQAAPSLRSVVLAPNHTNYPYIPQLLLLPWAQLTEFRMTYMKLYPDTIYTTLQQCLSLQSCSLSIRHGNPIPTCRPITLNHLTQLNFKAGHTRPLDWDRFLQPFITPSLISLSIDSQGISIPTLRAFVRRSCCSLQSLVIRSPDPHIDNNDLESLLGLLPSLTTFSAPWIISASVIQNMRNEKSGILPLLTHGTWSVHPDGLAEVLELLASRISQITQGNLSRLALCIYCHEGPGFAEARKAYVLSYDLYKRFEDLDITVYNANTLREITPRAQRAAD